LDPSALGVLNGYSLFSFICLYFYGQAFNGYLDLKKGRLFYFGLYLICSLLIFTLFFVSLKYFSVDLAWTAFSYNNPLVLISAISFFFFFKSLKISYTQISFFSSSVLAVYLIHEHPVSAELLTQNLNKLAIKYELGNVYFTLFLIAVLLFLCCTIIEKIRSAITEPVLNYVIERYKLDRLDKKVNL